MSARLASYKNGKVDLAFPLNEERITVGRSPDNIIQLDDVQVSKHHAVLTRQDDGWSLSDVGSTNGIIVNGVRVGQAKLKHGDHIFFGHFEFVFESDIDGKDWVPSHIIDISSKATDRTIPQEGE